MTYIQVNRGRYRGADGMPRTPSGGLTAAALGLAAALERGGRQAATRGAAAQPATRTAPAPAKASAPTFTGPKARAKALAWAVKNDPLCKGKAQAALTILVDNDLASVGPQGLIKLLQRAPANMALTPAAPRHADGWAHAAAHVNHTQGLADAPPRLAGGNDGWDKIHAKMRQRRGQ